MFIMSGIYPLISKYIIHGMNYVNVNNKLVVLQNFTIVDKLRQYLQIVHGHILKYTESHPKRQELYDVNWEPNDLCELSKEIGLDEIEDIDTLFD